jgi:hypothetical protein
LDLLIELLKQRQAATLLVDAGRLAPQEQHLVDAYGGGENELVDRCLFDAAAAGAAGACAQLIGAGREW